MQNSSKYEAFFRRKISQSAEDAASFYSSQFFFFHRLHLLKNSLQQTLLSDVLIHCKTSWTVSVLLFPEPDTCAGGWAPERSTFRHKNKARELSADY
jgi:hypothetical protein